MRNFCEPICFVFITDYRLTSYKWAVKNLTCEHMNFFYNFPEFFLNPYYLIRLVTKLSRDVIVVNELGLHARSAARIAEIARKANSNVWIIKGERKVDASSILDILTLECTKGSKITLEIDDQSDLDVLNDTVRQFETGFGELS